MSADRPTCDAAGAQLNCPPGEIRVTEDGHRVRAVWHPVRDVTRTALFRIVTDDGVAVLQHIRTVRLERAGGPSGCEVDSDVGLEDVPRCRRATMREEFGLELAEEVEA